MGEGGLFKGKFYPAVCLAVEEFSVFRNPSTKWLRKEIKMVVKIDCAPEVKCGAPARIDLYYFES